MNNTASEHVAAVEAVVAGRSPSGLGSVEKPIFQSWQRCLRTYGLDPSMTRHAAVYEKAQLREIQDRFGPLRDVAQAEMRNLYEQIAGSGYALMLTDANGVIVDSLIDPTLTGEFRNAGLWRGAVWNEEHQGTNGIGTCVIEHRPVTVHKNEHFLGYNIGLSCSGAPVWDAHGDLIAVLDASSVNSRDTRAIQSHTMALVNVSAEVISKCHFLSQYPHALIVRFHSRAEFVGLLHEGLIAVDCDGQVLACNASAMRQLGYAARSALVGHPITDIFHTELDALLRLAGREPLSVSPIREVRHGRRFFCTVRGPVRGRTDKPARPCIPSKRAESDFEFDNTLAGGDSVMQRNVRRAVRVIDRRIPVILCGATGTGKEAFARAMHRASTRAPKPFVAINCASIPEALVESELFGYARGTFTGALREGKRGRILQANGGTLFLDEIGDMPLTLQTRLLRVLEEREVVPLGGEQPVAVDLLVISATHRDLAAMVADGRFREDLYYRLNGLTLTLPPLRERADKAELIRSLLCAEEPPGTHLDIDNAAFQRLMAYDWPGNIRQLRNVLRTAAALCEPPYIRLDDLPPELHDDASTQATACSDPVEADEADSPLDRAERDTLLCELDKHGWNITHTAQTLGMSRNTLYRKLHKHGIGQSL